MYLEDYFWFLFAIIICFIFSAIASAKVHSSFKKYNGVRSRSGLTGCGTVNKLLQANGIFDISIGRVSGELSDHYHPKKAIINLSDSTYGSSSVAAIAVAAHEMGHVMQNKDGAFLYKVRTALVPVVNIGTNLAMPLVFIGLIIDLLAEVDSEPTGFYLAMIGVILYGSALLFSLVTLPVELDASRRAKKMLLSEGILSEDEIDGASKVLSAAALTYLASLLTSLVYFLRFLIRVLTLFGRRDRR